MIKLYVPTTLRSLTSGEGELSVEGATIRELLDNLELLNAGFKARICEPQGGVRRFINLYVNDTDFRDLGGFDAKLKQDDTVSVVVAVAGG